VLADPRLRLPDVAAEVAQLAGGDAADEASVQAALGRMLSRSDPSFKARIVLLVTSLLLSSLLFNDTFRCLFNVASPPTNIQATTRPPYVSD